MNKPLIEKIVNAVLYEGYMLYPYRPSVKNRQRWTFGGLYPRAYSEAQCGSDAWWMQTECLVRGTAETSLQVTVRLLHLMDRTVGELVAGANASPGGNEPEFRAVESLQIGDRLLHAWQEAVEREVPLHDLTLADLQSGTQRSQFSFPGSRKLEMVPDLEDETCGVIVREQQPIAGLVEVSATSVAENLWKLRVGIVNETSLEDSYLQSRDGALMRSMVSTHAILGVEGGEFVSLTDPPEAECEMAAGCQNVGAWPVLVGNEGDTNAILSSPIILYDYPQVAPESPGDLFDSTEIDEILILRIMTLTEAEKQAAVAVDERVRALLNRTVSLAMEQLRGLHGAMRGLQTVKNSTEIF